MIEISGQEDFARRWCAADPALRRALAGRWEHAADRDDVLQEAALATWRRRDWYDPDRPFAAWAWGFARRCRPLAASARPLNAAGSMAVEPADDDTEEVAAALAALSAEDARLLRAVLGENRPLAAVAAERGVSTRTLARQLHSARQRLRQQLVRRLAGLAAG